MTTAPSRLIFSVVLIVSLALNLFLGGRFLAHRIMGPPHGPEAMLSHLIADIGSGLAQPDRDALQKVFQAHEADIKARADDLREARDHIREAMLSDPFDGDALNAAMTHARDKDMALHKALEDMLFEAASGVSPEARHKIATSGPLARH